MRALVRPLTMSLSLLVAGALAPLTAQAQTDPNQPYQPQPGYQQPPQYPQQQYQQPQQYPQQQYQQPQQGYPQQQPYPQQPQQYPQQGYAPQGNPPPPGYYAPQPQPAYGQQPGYPPPQAYAPPPEEPFRRGFVFMPYLGLNVPVGDTSDYLSTGFRLGGIMGGMVGQFLSLNGELTIDVLEPKNTTAGYSTTEVEFDLAFSPLFHLRLPMLEIVVGPKLGIFGLSGTTSDNTGYYSDSTYSGSGAVWGLNSGAFIPIGRRMAVGGLLTYTVRSFSSCSNSSSTDCVSGPDEKFISLSGAFIF